MFPRSDPDEANQRRMNRNLSDLLFLLRFVLDLLSGSIVEPCTGWVDPFGFTLGTQKFKIDSNSVMGILWKEDTANSMVHHWLDFLN